MRPWRVAALAGLVAAAVAGGVAGYFLRDTTPHVQVANGRFYVGDHLAQAKVDGWEYAVEESVSWVDAQGAWHDRGWPDCLGPVGGTRTVRFGYVPVSGPPGAPSWRQVVWVSCLA